MRILNARFANAQGSCVLLDTQECGEVAIDLATTADISNGWRAVYFAWQGNTQAFVPAPPAPPRMEAVLEAHGYTWLAMANLGDIERKLPQLPPKCAALRQWVNGAQTALALGQDPGTPPFPYDQLQAELALLLQ
jgi:hypothetical protein